MRGLVFIMFLVVCIAESDSCGAFDTFSEIINLKKRIEGFHKIMQESHMPYEGAGFLLSHKGQVLLGRRIKKEEDLKKDPTPEVEYFGGKIDEEDKNDPYATAFNELVEETGQYILDDDWKQRTSIIHIFQPFSKKWIWCFRLELNEREYSKFVEANKLLVHWNVSEMRTFVGRSTPARKSILSFVSVSEADFKAYVQRFTDTVPKSKNRLNDAKEYRLTNTLKATSLSDPNDTNQIALRAFNIVIFEN